MLLRLPLGPTLALALAILAVPEAAASGNAPPSGERVRVACWNAYFPFEPEGPQFFEAPRRCSWYRRKAETYAEGAVLGKRLAWRWGDRRAGARGELKVPGTGTDFMPGRIRLREPVESCGRTVFSRLRYRIKGADGWFGRGFPIYTCRSSPGGAR